MMERFINNEWVECIESELTNGDIYRISIGGGFQQQQHVEVSLEDSERIWRDQELLNTDWIVSVTDHPQHSQYLTYRQSLRDYPNQPHYPNGTRPTL